MMCCVITRYHVMVGCDLHATWPQMPIPPWAPVGPHFVCAMSQFAVWWMADPMRSPTVETAAGQPLRKVFDIGMLIPHIGPNHPLILVLLLLTSSSQGHFGVSSVQIQTNDGHGPVAVALFLVANPQLNCDDISFYPLPLPTGILLAPNTVVAGLTLGDLIAGLLSMVFTSAATAVLGLLLNKVVGPFVKWIGGKLFNLLDDLIGRLVMRLPDKFFSAWFQGNFIIAILQQHFGPMFGQHADKIFGTLLGWLTGSPTGYSFPFAPFGSALNPIQALSERIGAQVDQAANQSGLNDYFNDVALIPTFPNPVPVPASTVSTPLSWLQGPLDVGRSVADPAANATQPVSQFLERLFSGQSY